MQYKINLISLLSLSLISLIAYGDDFNNSEPPEANPNLLANQNRPQSDAIIKDKLTAYINNANYVAIAKSVYTNLYLALGASTYIIKKDRTTFAEKTGSCATLGTFARTQSKLNASEQLQRQSTISSTYYNCWQHDVLYDGSSAFTVKYSKTKAGKTTEYLSTSNDLTIKRTRDTQSGNQWFLEGNAEVGYMPIIAKDPAKPLAVAIYSDFRYNFNRDKLNGISIAGYIEDDLAVLELYPQSRQELEQFGIVAVTTHAGSPIRLGFRNNQLVSGTLKIKCKNGYIIIHTNRSGQIKIDTYFSDIEEGKDYTASTVFNNSSELLNKI